jgi:UDP-N-acetylmuramate dehydrogenase
MTTNGSDIQIFDNASFKSLNNFNIDGNTRYLAVIKNNQQLLAALDFVEQNQLPYIVLGGGSNVLMTQDFNGLIVHMAIPDITLLDETAEHIYIQIGAGVNWHEFVQYCLAKQYYGIENLALIPGTVGAAPIQNIGAYGVEIKDVFHELEAINLATKNTELFDDTRCDFSYRNSLFKKDQDKYIVTNVTFRLNKQAHVVLTDRSVQHELEQLKISKPSPTQLSEIICQIRRRKLPYDKAIGNAGSFFTNPFISETHFNTIKMQYSDAIGFPAGEGLIKIAAGWMIDKCGWRGHREGDAGVYVHNALVLVNHGKATGTEILHLAEKIKGSVRTRFNVELEMEPRVY